MAIVTGNNKLHWKTGIDNKGLKKDAGQTKGLLGGISKQAKLLGVAILAAAATFAVLKSAFKNIIAAGMPFGETMSHLLAVTRASVSEFQNLRQSAMDLGATTAFTATQVGKMQVELAKLGFTTTEILGATADTLNLAAATGSDLAEAAAVAAGNLRVFNIDAKDTSRVTDVMAESFATSALDLEKFKESSKSAAPIMQAWGGNVEMMTTLLAKLADKQISGSIAGMGLKNMFGQLKDENSSVAQVLGGTAGNWEELIVLLKKAKERGKEFNDDALVNLDQRLKTVVINLVESSDALDDYYNNLLKADGAAKKMAETRLDNLTGDVTILKSAMEGFWLILYDKIQPALRDIVQLATRVVTVISNMLKAPQNIDSLHKELNNTKAEVLALLGVYKDLSENTNRTEHENELLKSTINKLNTEYSDYIGNIDLETASRYELNNAIQNTTRALIEEATTKYILEEKSELIDAIGKLQKDEIDTLLEKKVLEQEIEEEKRIQFKAYENLRSEIEEMMSRQGDLNDAEKISLRLKKDRLGQMDKEESKSDRLIQLTAKLNQTENKLNNILSEKIEKQTELNEHTNKYRDIFNKVDLSNLLKDMKELAKQRNLEISVQVKKSVDKEIEDLLGDEDYELEILPIIKTEDAEEEIEKLDSKLKEKLPEIAEFISETLSGAFAEFIVEGEKDWDQFLKYLEKQLLASALKDIFMQLFGVGADGSFGILGSLFGWGGSGTENAVGGGGSGLDPEIITNLLKNPFNPSSPVLPELSILDPEIITNLLKNPFNPSSLVLPELSINVNPTINNDMSPIADQMSEMNTRIAGMERAIQNMDMNINWNGKHVASVVNRAQQYNSITRDK